MTTYRLLFLDHADGIGGAEGVLLSVLAGLGKHEALELHLACPPGDLEKAAGTLGVHTHTIEFPRLKRSLRAPLDLLACAIAIHALSKEIDADLLYSNTMRSSTITSLLARFSKRPWIWHMHDLSSGEGAATRPRIDAAIRSLIAKPCHSLIVISSVAAHSFAKPWSERAHIVHNGIDVNRFAPASVQSEVDDDAPDTASGTIRIGMVGRLRPIKGHLEFVDCMNRLGELLLASEDSELMKDLRFTMVGGSVFGDAEDYIQKLDEGIEKSPFASHFELRGHRDDVRSELSDFDIFVNPGRAEPFGLVNVEAMAMGLPVVGFAHGAMPEIVIDGESGRLVPSGDIDALAQACSQLVVDRDLGRQMGTAGRRRAENLFTQERMVDQIHALIKNALETDEARP